MKNSAQSRCKICNEFYVSNGPHAPFCSADCAQKLGIEQAFRRVLELEKTYLLGLSNTDALYIASALCARVLISMPTAQQTEADQLEDALAYMRAVIQEAFECRRRGLTH
jgi:hypothetical protein